MKKIMTASLKTAEEITGAKGVISFIMDDNASYLSFMNDMAKKEIRKEITPLLCKVGCSEYDYSFGIEDMNFAYSFVYVKKEWIKDIREVVNWSEVPIDTKVRVKMHEVNNWINRHFAGVRSGKPMAFGGGVTSHTVTSQTDYTFWPFIELVEEI